MGGPADTFLFDHADTSLMDLYKPDVSRTQSVPTDLPAIYHADEPEGGGVLQQHPRSAVPQREALPPWTVGVLTPVSSGIELWSLDPHVLASYLLSILRRSPGNGELAAIMEQLSDLQLQNDP